MLRIVSMLLAPLALAPMVLPPSGGMTEAIAKDAIINHTFLQACHADVPPVFEQVQIGTPVKRKVEPDQAATALYPVHARYTSVCRYGDNEMKAEVDMRVSFFRDPFGKWVGVDWGSDQDQSWDSASSGVRCRVQGVAHIQSGPDGKETGRTPFKDTSFEGCTVMFKAGD